MAAPSSLDSVSLFERARRRMPGGVNSPVRAFRSVGGAPFFVARAQGPFLTTVEGRELLDFVCTWGPAIHGHNDPEIREAVSRAVRNGLSFGAPCPAEVAMAELVAEMVPCVEKVRMTNSGTEATMSAIRLARGCAKRDKIVKFAGCYHGHVDSLLIRAGSGALTLGNPDSAGVPACLARETIVLPFNDTDALEAAFRERGDQIAGVILEPYPANVGLIRPRPGFLPKLRQLCDECGASLIFDEVMTGFRVAPGGVQEIEGVTPDIVALGKIIGGGLPVGAVGGRAELMDQFAPEGPVYQAGTLSGNPLAMAAGVASLRQLRERDPYPSLEAKGRQIRDALLETARAKGLPLQVPQAGSMFSLYFSASPVENYEQAVASDTAQFPRLFSRCLENGVYLPPSPFETCFLSAAHSQGDVDRACSVMTEALQAL